MLVALLFVVDILGVISGVFVVSALVFSASTIMSLRLAAIDIMLPSG
jgi:hypothetical protein